jgi:cysteine desulfuration protein SufE
MTMQKTIKQKQEELQKVFSTFSEDKDAKWGYLLSLAKAHKGMDASLKDEKFLVKGCAARMFLVPQYNAPVLDYFMDTEGGVENPLISRGLGAIAVNLYSGHTPADILQSFADSPGFFQSIGLTVGLTPTRANGFASLMKQVSLYAQVYARMGA